MQWGTYIGTTCLAQQQYRFSYDAANRLTAADHYTNSSGSWTFTNNYTESNITYDLNGNLKTYTRRGLTSAPSTFGVIDNLTYAYSATIPDSLIAMTDAGNITKVISLITINLVTIKNKLKFMKMINKHNFSYPHIVLLFTLIFFYISNVYYWITIKRHGGYEYKPGFFYPKESLNYFLIMIIHSFLVFLFIFRYKNAGLGRALFVSFTILCALYLTYYLYSEFYFISHNNKLLYMSILFFLTWAFINDIQ